jgi:hypothetical protein
VTWTVKLEFAAVVAVPVIAPVEAFRLRPVGSAPAVMDQVYGVLPPVAVNVDEYATPTVASGGVCAGIESWPDCPPTVMLVAKLAVCAGFEESETCNVNAEFPFAVGVPVIAPVDALSERPAGRLPVEIDQVYGRMPPVAVGRNEKSVPTLAAGSVALPIARGATTLIVSGHAKDFGGVFESVTVTVKEDVPTVVGMPVIAPVEAFKASPEGNVPLETAHVNGNTPPLTVTDVL